MKSRAMVLEAFGEPLVMREFEAPPLESGQLLVRMDAAGVCGSDIHIRKGGDPRTPLPIIPGHEGVGTVVDMAGDRFTVDGGTIASGDRIIWNRGVTCGACWFCRVAKEPYLCPHRLVYGINLSCSDPPYLNGCYAEHLVLRAGTDIFAVGGDIDPAVLVSASCSGATVAHAFDEIGGGLAGTTVVVQGPGPLGAWAVAFARRLGAERIFVIGGSAERLSVCRAFGATDILDRHASSPDERKEAVLEATAGRGADYAVEAVGRPGAAGEGIRLLRKGGTYLSIGYSQPAGSETIDFYRDIVSKNVRVRGVWVSDAKHLRDAVSLATAEPALFARLVTHRFDLGDADEALDVMADRKALKAVLTFP